MNKGLRMVLLLVAAVAVILISAMAYLHFRGLPVYEVEKIHFDTSVKDAASLAKGEKIAAVQCVVCHMGSDGKLSGRKITELPEIFGEVYSANITHSKTHGIGNWTDEQLVYFLRTGVKPSGTFSPIMPKYPRLSDDDLRGIITFLRSENPVVQSSEIASVPSHYSLMTKFLSQTDNFRKVDYPKSSVETPDSNDAAAFGRYLVCARYDCFPCHSADFKSMDMQTPEHSGGYLGGGNAMVTAAGNLIYTANITCDESTGIGKWTETDFANAMRKSISKNQRQLRMPMPAYNAMTDAEIHAIWTYLHSVPALKNEVNRQWDKEEL
ncbi:MAG: cytochrome c [Chitinophagales bacterium]